MTISPSTQQTMMALIQGCEGFLRDTIMTYLAKLLILFKLLVVYLLCSPTLVWAVESGTATVEQHYATTQKAIAEFKDRTTLQDRQRMQRTSWKQRRQLPPRLQERYETWYQLIEQKNFWKAGTDLKQLLLGLQEAAQREQAAVRDEADRIVQAVLGVFQQKGKEWNMLSSAIMNNMLINMNIRKNGFCWHWVEAFMEVLYPMELNYYDLHWGVAYVHTMRENNSLVITAKDQAFTEGVMIDAWRSSGRPFWRIVKEDRFPWVERTDIRVTYCEDTVCTVPTDEWVDPES